MREATKKRLEGILDRLGQHQDRASHGQLTELLVVIQGEQLLERETMLQAAADSTRLLEALEQRLAEGFERLAVLEVRIASRIQDLERQPVHGWMARVDGRLNLLEEASAGDAFEAKREQLRHDADHAEPAADKPADDKPAAAKKHEAKKKP